MKFLKSNRALNFATVLVLLGFLFSNLLNAQIDRRIISKGPYLQAPGSNTMTIMWEATVNRQAVIHYGADGNLNLRLVVNSGKQVESSMGGSTSLTSLRTNFYIYQATLRGLTPGVIYSYSVEFGGIKTPVKKFKTFEQSSQKVKFIAYGDTRTNPDIHSRLVAHFKKFSPEFILHTGDLVSKGSRYDVWWREFFQPMENVIDEVPLYPVLGNHEEKSENYFNYFILPEKEIYYAFEDGPLFVLGLDYHFQKLSDEQYKFAERALQTTKSPWKIVMVHDPMFNVGGHISGWGHRYYLPLFHRTKVDMVIAGHSHIYERFKPILPSDVKDGNPITHITTGGGGAPLTTSVGHPALAAYARVNHFLTFEVTRTNLFGRCYDINGQIIDEFELVKPAGQYPPTHYANAYSEEQLRLSLELATNLVARATNLPTPESPAFIMFRIVPSAVSDSPITLEIQPQPTSLKYYRVVPERLIVTTPPHGGSEKTVWVRVFSNVIVKEGGSRQFEPPLVFQATVKSGGVQAISYGKPTYISDTAIKEAKKVGVPISGE
ncbi:MAG: metallophosphoesterase family protein [Verrucomicrobiae bacterium]|nr:metallophosphoesterase family protein [Verrucomicrobiae bacterium]